MEGLDAIEGGLERELAQVRRATEVMRTVAAGVQATRENVRAVVETSANTDALLERWIAILSQTNATYGLLGERSWEGSSVAAARWQKREEQLAGVMKEMERVSARGKTEAERGGRLLRGGVRGAGRGGVRGGARGGVRGGRGGHV